MTVHRNGDLCFECDECGDLREFDGEAEFTEVWRQLKEEDNWRCVKQHGKWRHFCRKCVSDWAEEQRQQRDEGHRERRERGRDDDPPF